MKLILTYKYWLIGLMILASLAVSGGLTKLSVSHRMDDYFSADGDELDIYTQYRDIFGDDDQFILISIASDSGIYKQPFLEELLAVKKRLGSIEGVERVFWIDEMMPGQLRLRKRFVDKIKGRRMFVSKDQRSASFLVLHKYIDQKELMEPLIEEIKQNLSPFEAEEIKIAGKIYLTTVLEKFIKEDSAWLFMVAAVLILGLLFLILGSIRLLFISLAVPTSSIVFTMGLMGSLGFHVNLFTNLVPTLILIISVSDIIHLVKGAGPRKSSDRVRYHFAALLLTTLTTAIGFGSLLTTQIGVIMEFGGFVAIGVLYTFLFTLLLFSIIPLEQYSNKSIIDPWLDRTVDLVNRVSLPKSIQGLLIALFCMFIYVGISQVRTNAHLVTGVPIHSAIKQDALHFDKQFAGTRPLSIFIERKDLTEALDKNVLLKLDSLIKQYIGTDFLIGPHQEGSIPLQVTAENGRFLRFYGLMKDVGSEIAIPRFNQLIQALDADPLFVSLKIRDTGLARMLDKNTTDIAKSISLGLCTAMLITFILLSIYFRGIGIAFISILVNIIPLFVLAATYGFLGIELRAGTSVVFSIAFGIAIDDTMHMLATYKKHRDSGKDFSHVIQDAGKPIFMTTLIFGIGFSVLIFSGLEAISVLGLSMVIGCVSALFSDLFVLPGMLRLIEK